MISQHEHDGHRDRLRKKFMDNGIDSLEPHEVLELCLFYAIPQKNTNPIAHHLIKEFGSISAVFDAPVNLLISKGKVTKRVAIFLKLIPGVARLYYQDTNSNPDKIISLETLPQYFINKFIGLQNEENFILLLIDRKGKELYSGVVSKGSFTQSVVPTRRIVSLAMDYHAYGAVLAHNHPSGIAFPSEDDFITTQNIARILQNIDVNLIDHYIVADDDYISMFEIYGDKIYDND